MHKPTVLNNNNHKDDDVDCNANDDKQTICDDEDRRNLCQDEFRPTSSLIGSSNLKKIDEFKMYPRKNGTVASSRPSKLSTESRKSGKNIGKSVHKWTVEEVGHWLLANNFDHYIDLFRRHRIDGSVLISLDDHDLRYEPLKLQVLGDIKRLNLALDQLRTYEKQFKKLSPTVSKSFAQKRIRKRTAAGNGSFLSEDDDDFRKKYLLEETEGARLNDDGISNRQTYSTISAAELSQSESFSSLTSSVSDHESSTEEESNIPENKLINRNAKIQAKIVPTVTTPHKLATLINTSHPGYSSSQRDWIGSPAPRPSSSSYLAPGEGSSSSYLAAGEGPSSSSSSSNKNNGNADGGIMNHSSQYPLQKKYHKHHHRNNEFKPEAWKAFVALCYFFASTWVTAIVMVIVHDRVPDMDTYPPLPDLILDNLPLIPWAFSMAETCGLVLFIIWALILTFHKHRFILLRRMFSLFGSVFLLRCFTMVITSLSVPGRHLQCKARPYGTWMERLHQALLIWQGGGMSIKGVRTCGDYMFSGHTVVLTMLNFFITEYTPRWLSMVHTASWVLNLFGVFFILAAHEHYSIDVFIAFYISTRLFLYYHTLANNRALYQPDRRRTRIWFPLFSFFESGVAGIVPNEYEIPFRGLKDRILQWMSRKICQSSLVRILYEWDFSGTGSDPEDNSEKSLLGPSTTTTTENSKHVKTQ